jgi:hypothetical protein
MDAWGFVFLAYWDCVVRDLDLLAYTQAAFRRAEAELAQLRVPEVTKKCLNVGDSLSAV